MSRKRPRIGSLSRKLSLVLCLKSTFPQMRMSYVMKAIDEISAISPGKDSVDTKEISSYNLL